MEKARRQQRIRELLARNRIDNQEQLHDLLLAEGVPSTQSTLSRDLRELGVVKGPEGYRLPGSDPKSPDALNDLAEALRPALHSVDVGGNIVVLRTGREHQTHEVAGRIHRAQLHQVAGVMGSGGVVLVVARSPSHARELARRLGGGPPTGFRRRR